MSQTSLPTQLIRSRYISRVQLDDTYTGLCHILGRTRFLCHQPIVSLLDAFQQPQDIRPYLKDARISNILETLTNANLIQPADNTEADVIRAFYARRFLPSAPDAGLDAFSFSPDRYGLIDNSEIISGIFQQRFDVARPRYVAKGDVRLVLASGLAILTLPADEVAVTHFSARRLHLSAKVWEIARSFESGALPSEVAVRFADELTPVQMLGICQFLLDRGLLWPSADTERAYLASVAGRVTDRNKPLISIDAGCEQWEQKYLPYDLPALQVPVDTALTIAVIGFCQVHAYTPALQYLAQRCGVALSICSFVGPGTLSGVRRDWSAVIYSRTRAAAALYEAFALNDYRRYERLAKAVIPDYDRELCLIRACTDAPILVHSLGRPGLLADADTSEAAHAVDFVLDRLNRDLEQCLKAHGNAWLLNEDQVASRHAGGVFWDDEYNGLPHHSCVSLWGRPPRSFFFAAKPSVIGEDVPPIVETQADPAASFAAAYLRFIAQIGTKRPVRMIIFEPNELLWQGRLENKPAPHPPNFNFYTGDHYSLYIGINEALMTLRRQGVLLVCNSTCPTHLLMQRWKIDSTYTPVVRLADLSDVYGGEDRAGHLMKVMRDTGISGQEVLYIDLCAGAPPSFAGSVYTGEKWGLRRYLLTAPHLYPLPRRDVECKAASALQSPAALLDSPADDSNDDTVRSVLYELLGGALRCSLQDLERTDDLRLLGLDSLGVVGLIMRIEDALKIKFHDSDMLADTVFFSSGLIRATQAKIRGQAQVAIPSAEYDGASTDCLLGGLSYEQWCEQDLALVLGRHISAPALPWILKTVRSPAKYDYEYQGWHGLHAKACGYMDLYREFALQTGAVVTILLPQGSGVVAAWLGAILGRQVPSISAYPSEKLSIDAFMLWFGKIVRQSESRLVVCAPELRGVVEECLSREGLQLPCIDTVPPPVYGREAPAGAAQPDLPALLQHSSGTTGLKKAVMLSHRSVLAQIWDLAHALKVQRHDTVVSWLPLYHDMGLIASLVFPLVCSLRLVLISPFHWARQPSVLMEQITEESGSLCWLPNFAYLHCANRIPDRRLGEFDLSSLRALISCSEPVTANAQRAFAEKFSQCGFRMSSLSSSYAMAETTFAVTQARPGRPSKCLRINMSAFQSSHAVEPVADDDNVTDSIQLVSSGSVLPHVAIRITDDSGQPLSPGRAGEICMRGDYLMQAYCNDPETTHSAIRDGWYFSGDIGFIYEDELYVAGRKKDIVIVAGQNIYPHDVEELVSTAQGVRPGRVVAFGVFDADKGTEALIVLAELALQETAGDTPLDLLRREIHEKVLSGLGVSVGDLRFYPAQTLLKSTSGKLSRHRNRDMYLADLERERNHARDGV